MKVDTEVLTVIIQVVDDLGISVVAKESGINYRTLKNIIEGGEGARIPVAKLLQWVKKHKKKQESIKSEIIAA